MEKTIDFQNKEIHIGDKVSDIFREQGVFIVEDIKYNGWVWGSGMKDPYYNNDKKNFLYNRSVNKIERNIGKEFVDWAEENYKFKEIIKKGVDDLIPEYVPYDFMRQTFIDKINELIETKK